MINSSIKSDNIILNKIFRQMYGCCNPRWLKIDSNISKNICHVFPVVVDTDDERVGLMVGIDVKETRTEDGWRLSDAFGRMGFESADGKGKEPLHEIFDRVEKFWEECHGGVLPLRWRKPASLYLLAKVHLDSIGGESLQVPLLITLLRVAASGGKQENLPFGAKPVFATGRLPKDAGNGFGPVDDIIPKAKGFIREYGRGLPALVTNLQKDEMEECGDGLINLFDVHMANNIPELLKLGPLREGLSKLCEAPHETELDQLLLRLDLVKKQQAFRNVEQLCAWLLPHLDQRPYYKSLILRQTAEFRSHDGDYGSARKHICEAREIQEQNSKIFGVSERIHLATIQQVNAFDSGAPEEAEDLFRTPETTLSEASPPDLARYWGAACQLFRAVGRFGDAIDAGNRAVDASLIGAVSETHRDVNYLIHAYLSRARSAPETKDSDLISAEEWLRKSTRDYCPLEGTKNYQTHKIFCAHLRAEWLRLRGSPCDLEFNEWKPDTWHHAALFYYLSVARNTKNSPKIRLEAGDFLLNAGNRFAERMGGIFHFFSAIYRTYYTVCLQEGGSGDTNRLRKELDVFTEKAGPGWSTRLNPFLDKIDVANSLEDARMQMETLCDAVYFH